jgi:integrase
VQRSERLGTVKQYPTKASAEKHAAKLLEEVNDRVAGIKVSGLCDRFIKDGMDVRSHTAMTYRSLLKRVRSDWGDCRLDEMVKDIMAMEDWVNNLTTLPTEDRLSKRGEFIKGRPAKPMSKKTKLHMKAFLSRMIECAMKWGLLTLQRNPVGLIQVKGKRIRVRTNTLLTGKQYRAIIKDPDLPAHVRVMIQVAMYLGLRACEILGLQWTDIDYKKKTIMIQRSVVDKDVDDPKTRESAAELSLHSEIVAILKAWKKAEEPVEGWVFGNILTKRPFWRGTLQQDYLVPAGKKVGIESLGWHDFRHTYRAMMGELDIPIEMQKTLMRHADISTTLSYGGKRSLSKTREANAMVVEMLRKRA